MRPDVLSVTERPEIKIEWFVTFINLGDRIRRQKAGERVSCVWI